MQNAKMTYSVALNYVLENCDLPTDVKEKVEALKVSVEKKGANKKPTKVQTENEALKVTILELLSEQDNPVPVSTLVKALDNTYSSQKISALLSQMVDSGKVIKNIDKRQSLFSVAR